MVESGLVHCITDLLMQVDEYMGPVVLSSADYEMEDSTYRTLA